MKKHRSPSQFWDTALNKIFPRRASRSRSDEYDAFMTFGSSAVSEHTDGFYMYSQALLDQENRRREALLLRQSDSTDVSYSSALMAPIPRPALPYTISSPEWNIFSEAVKALEDAIDDDASDWIHSVLSIFAKVYAVAKIVVTILMYYGIEVEDIPDSVPAHIRRMEEVVTSDSIIDLIDAVESLYYSLYARLIMEIANVDLSTCFNLELRRASRKEGFTLPEPDHLLKIMAHCKNTLEAPTVCNNVNVDLVKVHQDEFIRRAMERAIGTGFFLDDLLGYRRYTMGIVSDISSKFRQKWNHNTFLYQIPPEEILTVQSEKYLSFIPKPEAVLSIAATELPFVDRDSIDPEIWESELVKDHRQSTLAKMEGKGIGDIRRGDDRRRPSDYMTERKCICRSSCICSLECTTEPERQCPCADRMMQIMLAKRREAPGTRDFSTRCGNLARAIFEGASLIKRDMDDIEITIELDQAFSLVSNEIQKQRPGMVPKTVSTSATVLISSSLSSPWLLPSARNPQWIANFRGPRIGVRRYTRAGPSYGITTPVPDRPPQFPSSGSQSPFCFQTGYALCAKRPSRPFPPPFLSPPSSSFSDPLTTHYLSQDKRLSVGGELIRGLNNGDDAVLVADNFLGVDDGVGAWATKPRGHAALWSRLLLHFWALQVEREVNNDAQLDPIRYLQRAYEETTRATATPSEWYGTTTSVTAILHWKCDDEGNTKPLLYVTNLGDCKVLVIRPSEEKVLFRTKEQWHWFDCPVQLGTNSVDTPQNDAVLSRVDLEEEDVVLAVSDGVLDNLWEHEIVSITLESMKKWNQGRYDNIGLEWAPPEVLAEERMVFVARELLKSALAIAQDPFAESPFMERAIEEGLAIEGGKAKRSKKYRKLMHQYELAFGFREPYQVLVDSNFLQAVHSFKMELIPYLERTLQGKVKPLLTKCSLAKIMANQPLNPRTNNPVRPAQLPPPTVLPLRHCTHNEDETPIDEVECLLSLLSPSADVKRNKEHYILATADPATPKAAAQDANAKKRKRGVDEGEVALRKSRMFRSAARAIPGVPIVYVKRSVMVLEPMSSLSEELRDGYENGKFRAGLNDEAVNKKGGEGAKTKKGMKKVKGPNPLSVKKPKKRVNESGSSRPAKKRDAEGSRAEDGDERAGDGDGDSAPKPKRRRRHHNRGARTDGDGEEPSGGGDTVAMEE
ncbi:uncharacterized protein BDW43DRAFT_300353 [Aspergillus alliaceus]|uniref:uncharacterized protein n=1 Tax=Petromyces alliaceus TaxID=209559 RepID=UPI0012A50B21|nr:uncharacterized protein BDW43DRAFT_300353 [Aspergillus alliaceus]KAB8233515.1 hypothetical protein BDW43DRAFT_300353 [Aspergillus alliaceus]